MLDPIRPLLAILRQTFIKNYDGFLNDLVKFLTELLIKLVEKAKLVLIPSLHAPDFF